MAINFSKYQHLAEKFNVRYGVKFSYADFETGVLRDKYVGEDNFGSKRSFLSVENNKYIDDFVEIFDKAFTNAVDGKIKIFTAEDIVKDYNEMMDGYREACKDNGTPLGQNWVANSKLMRKVESEMKDVPEGKQDFIGEEYLRGALRIRDMRRYTRTLQDQNVDDPEKLAAIWNYANALQKINDGRPGRWRVFHIFRNGAEKREAKNMRNFVMARLRAFDLKNGEGSGMAQMLQCARDSTIRNLKDSIKTAYVAFKQEEEAAKLKVELQRVEEKKKVLPKEEDPVEEREIDLEDEKNKERIGDIIENDLKESLMYEKKQDEKPQAKELSIEERAPEV